MMENSCKGHRIPIDGQKRDVKRSLDSEPETVNIRNYRIRVGFICGIGCIESQPGAPASRENSRIVSASIRNS